MSRAVKLKLHSRSVTHTPQRQAYTDWEAGTETSLVFTEHTPVVRTKAAGWQMRFVSGAVGVELGWVGGECCHCMAVCVCVCVFTPVLCVGAYAYVHACMSECVRALVPLYVCLCVCICVCVLLDVVGLGWGEGVSWGSSVSVPSATPLYWHPRERQRGWGIHFERRTRGPAA